MTKTAQEFADLEQDFDALSHTSMMWDQDTWQEQADDGRFEGTINFDHKVIFWFESYTAAYLAKILLKQMNEEYEVIFDTYSDEWAVTTTLVTKNWR